MDIIACTTAVTRPELHRTVFSKYMEFIKDVKVHWLINIDPIPNSPTPKETMQSLLAIINNDNISTEFNITSVGGNRLSFFNSAHRLINKVDKITFSKYGVLWLEDDWLYTGEYLLKDILSTLTPNSTKKDYVQLVNRDKEVSFNPGLITMSLFEKFITNINNKNHGHYGTNPERTCVSPKEAMDKVVDSHYIYPCFKDVGRNWQNSKNLGRTFNYN